MTWHYHGTPITPAHVLATLAGRCFCVSFAAPDQVARCHEIGQSVMLDNGAFSVWRRGQEPDWPGYYEWCERWLAYRTTWAVIPDVIEGTEEENALLIAEWPFGVRGAPVWHLNESLDRLDALCTDWPKVCIGSSGDYAVIGTPSWHNRMAQAMGVACQDGLPRCDLHMLRGMAQVVGPYPFTSVDSTDVAQNHHRSTALAKASRWDSLQCPVRWTGAEQPSLPESRDLFTSTVEGAEAYERIHGRL